MKERASWPMKDFEVRAILEGRKTQTRRLTGLENANAMPDLFTVATRMLVENGSAHAEWTLDDNGIERVSRYKCPYGQPGDRLWVRETWMPDPSCDDDAWDDAAISFTEWCGCGMPMRFYPDALKSASNVLYRASWDGSEMVGWKPSIHMPRWASRITLEIVSVRVERLNEISEDDAIAEGIEWNPSLGSYNCAGKWRNNSVPIFLQLWESINGAGSWEANPWVWVVEFKKVQP